MFFVIDWIDWSGKGTQLQLVREELEKMGKSVWVFDYPRYGLWLSHYVEKYLNWWYWDNVSAKLWSLFYALDRFDESLEIKKAIEEKDFVISNRYVSASIIHQASKIDSDKEFKDYIEWISDLEYNICWIPRPDKTIFLAVNPEISKKLVLNKENRDYIKTADNLDLHERNPEHMRKAHDRAIRASELLWWDVVNCLDDAWKIKSKEEIMNDILQKIL